MSSTSKTTTSSSRGSNRYPEETRRQAVDPFNGSLPEYETRQATAEPGPGLARKRRKDSDAFAVKLRNSSGPTRY
jgi:hypothetical protein